MTNIERTILELEREGVVVALHVTKDPESLTWRARIVDVTEPRVTLFDARTGDLALDVTAGTMAQAIAEIDARCAG